MTLKVKQRACVITREIKQQVKTTLQRWVDMAGLTHGLNLSLLKVFRNSMKTLSEIKTKV